LLLKIVRTDEALSVANPESIDSQPFKRRGI